MKTPKACSRRSLIITAILLLLLTAVADSAIFATARLADAHMGQAPDPAEVPPLVQLVGAVAVHHFWNIVVPASAAIWLLWTLFLWRTHAALFKGLGVDGQQQKKPRDGKPAGPAVDPAETKKREQRLYVHLISLMQREGRLVDFLTEDLGDYDDAQIGAAARSVHQGCRKALDRHLTLGAILDQEEDGDITVPKGFDPSATTLTGNVTGEPPFEGIVLHRGWRVKRFNLPTFSGSEDASLVAPSEVEVR